MNISKNTTNTATQLQDDPFKLRLFALGAAFLFISSVLVVFAGANLMVEGQFAGAGLAMVGAGFFATSIYSLFSLAQRNKALSGSFHTPEKLR